MNLPGRNDQCHCGSGKKYKKCCLEKDEQNSRVQNEVNSSQNSEKIYKELTEEDRIIEEFYDEIDSLDFKTETSEIISKIKTFMFDYPHLVDQADIIDTLFSIEQELFRLDRIEEYISLVEYFQQQAPDTYLKEFGWFDPVRIKHAIANRNFEKVGPLLTNFKKDPFTFFNNLVPVIDLLAWIGAAKELFQLIDTIHQKFYKNDEFIETASFTNWIYFKLTIEAARSSDSVEACLNKIKQIAEEQYASIDIDDIYNDVYTAQAIESIRTETPNWRCPYNEQDQMDDFFTAMGWNLFTYISKRTGSNFVQTKAIVFQLENFWSRYLYAEVPPSAVYLITSARIKKFVSSEDGLQGIAFLQAVWYFTDFLNSHNKIEKKTMETLQREVENLYRETLQHTQDTYPAHALIGTFPEMYCGE